MSLLCAARILKMMDMENRYGKYMKYCNEVFYRKENFVRWLRTDVGDHGILSAELTSRSPEFVY